jgi:hypothetical protein
MRREAMMKAAVVTGGAVAVAVLALRRYLQEKSKSAHTLAAADGTMYISELVCSSFKPASPPLELKRLVTDTVGIPLPYHYGIFDSMYLAGTWFYDTPLDAQAIKRTMGALVTRMPVLAGRRKADVIVLNNEGARFSVSEEHPGSAYDFLPAVDEHMEKPTLRGRLQDTPRSGAMSQGLLGQLLGQCSEEPLFILTAAAAARRRNSRREATPRHTACS